MAIVQAGDVGLTLVFDEPEDMSLIDLSSTFYDIGLLYDWAVLTTLPEYADYRFTGLFWSRNGRPIQPEHRLQVRRVQHESPILLELILSGVVAATAVPWTLIQAAEKVYNWPLNRKKLVLEVEDLDARKEERSLVLEQRRAERDEAFLRREMARLELERPAGDQRDGDRSPAEVEESIVHRLERDPLQVVDASFKELTDLQPGDPDAGA